jgi:hypothetical protein
MQAQAPRVIGDLVFDRTGRYLVGLGPGSFVPTGLPTGVAVTVWDTHERRELLSLPTAEGTIALDFSADQRRFAAMSNTGELRLWTLPHRDSVRAITLDPGPIAFSRSGRWLAMGSRSVRIIDTESARAVAQLDLGGEIRGLEFRDDDSLIAALRFESGAQDGVVEVHRWRPEDMLADACRRMPVGAAEKQWRQLLPDQPVPSPCAMLSAPARTL